MTSVCVQFCVTHSASSSSSLHIHTFYYTREKASDLRCWLEAYRFWNQGGLNNVKAMLQLVVSRYLTEQQRKVLESLTLPELEITPDIGLLHPLLDGYASHPKSCEFSSNCFMSFCSSFYEF
jgi:hypothetical protein